MRGRSPSISLVEAQYDAKRHSGQALDFVQLRIDPLAQLEQVDSQLRRRQPGSRPGQRRLLTERRDAMRALAAELAPTTYVLTP